MKLQEAVIAVHRQDHPHRHHLLLQEAAVIAAVREIGEDSHESV